MTKYMLMLTVTLLTTLTQAFAEGPTQPPKTLEDWQRLGMFCMPFNRAWLESQPRDHECQIIVLVKQRLTEEQAATRFGVIRTIRDWSFHGEPLTFIVSIMTIQQMIDIHGDPIIDSISGDGPMGPAGGFTVRNGRAK